jgi:hypothetical protein
MMPASSSSAKQRSSSASALSLVPRSSTPWFRTSLTPASSMARVACATSGVTDWAAFTWVWMAMLTPRERAVAASRAMPARTSSDSQCCGSPIRALLASLMSLIESI